jgi:hypothetical protein
VAYTEDTRVWPMLLDLASCVCAEFNKAGLPEFCFCGIVPGLAVFDFCGENCEEGTCGGMAWVSPRIITPSQEGAVGVSVSPRRCQTPMLDVGFEVGAVRCAPMPDSDGTPPSMAVQLEAARLQMADMAAIERALLCCFSETPALDTWVSIGPDGGCLGGVWAASYPVL